MECLTTAQRPALPAPRGPAAALCPQSGRLAARQHRPHSNLMARSMPPQNSVQVVEPVVASGGAAPAAATALDAAATWAAFADAVSGEWEGITASFNPDGTPIQLPEYYVPQAYRDWGVELFDWQSQSSMLANAEGLTATNRRMMPTVGCEADAIAYTQDACQLFAAPGAASSSDTAPPTIAADGSYSHGPADISAPDTQKAAFEQCLVLEVQARRLRVVHNLRRVGGEGRWALDSVELHSERYDSPYRGKLELSGCGGGMKAFATSEPLAADALSGTWVASGVRYSADTAASSSGGCACAGEGVRGESWSAEVLPGLLLHPLRAWTSCSIEGDDVSLAAGVVLDEGGSSMAVATRRLVGGRLVAAELLRLSRAPA